VKASIVRTVCGAARWQRLLVALAFILPSAGRAGVVEVDLINNDIAEVHGAILQWVSSATVTNGRFVPFLQINATGIAGDYNRKKIVQVQDVPVVSLNGTDFLQFALDVQGAVLSLDTIEIFTAATPARNTTDLGDIGVKRWDLDKSCWDYATQTGTDCDPSWDDVVVQIDPHRNPKPSGVDVFLYVPAVEFTGAQPTDYVYFFCVFGNPWKPVTSTVTLHPKGPGAAKWGFVKPLSP